MGSTDKPKDIGVSHKARCSSMGVFEFLLFGFVCFLKKKNRSQWETGILKMVWLSRYKSVLYISKLLLCALAT